MYGTCNVHVDPTNSQTHTVLTWFISRSLSIRSTLLGVTSYMCKQSKQYIAQWIAVICAHVQYGAKKF